MASNSLPDCILKQNTFLHFYHFLAEFYAYFCVIFPYPFSPMMCGNKQRITSVASKSVKNELKKGLS